MLKNNARSLSSLQEFGSKFRTKQALQALKSDPCFAVQKGHVLLAFFARSKFIGGGV